VVVPHVPTPVRRAAARVLVAVAVVLGVLVPPQVVPSPAAESIPLEREPRVAGLRARPGTSLPLLEVATVGLPGVLSVTVPAELVAGAARDAQRPVALDPFGEGRSGEQE